MSARHGKLFSDLSANCFHSQRKYLSGSEFLKNTCGSGFISQVFLLGLIVMAKILLNLRKLGKKLTNYDMSGKNFRKSGKITMCPENCLLPCEQSPLVFLLGTEKRERLCRTCVHSLWSRQSKNLDNYV
jgi:uncharacterized paraquat-inducible protein A